LRALTQTYLPKQQRLVIVLAMLALLCSEQSFAQVDAGALQRGLEQQLPLPSPLALPEPTAKESGPANKAKGSEVHFTVTSFVLEGVKILPEAEIQAVLKPWLGKEVSFDDL